jgi:quercetin dioxygenase-like cupin family protein
MDNHLPITLKEGDVITIPKGEYHRVLKGNGDLIVKIKEY